MARNIEMCGDVTRSVYYKKLFVLVFLTSLYIQIANLFSCTKCYSSFISSNGASVNFFQTFAFLMAVSLGNCFRKLGATKCCSASV